ncbi:MAG TPA: hypothetical protein VFW28_03860 [Micropepsaceae bacterium]|nr:hypothetical protein [Micropepsaceae bacterium]
MLWPATFVVWTGLLFLIPRLFAAAGRMMGACQSVSGISCGPSIPVIQLLTTVPLYVAAVVTPVILYEAGRVRAATHGHRSSAPALRTWRRQGAACVVDSALTVRIR